MKRIIKSNPLLFKIWYYVYRKNRGLKINYFNSQTNFMLDGYPRSGNTFFAGLCKKAFNQDNFIHHFHTIAPIKIALNKKLPVFILIRKPAEAISSYYLKSFALSHKNLPETIDKRLLKNLIHDYYDYYSFVYTHKVNIHIIAFEKYIIKPFEVLNSINEIVFNKKYNVNHELIETYQIEYKGATDTLGSSRPNEIKEMLKAEIKENLITNKHYIELTELYNKITHCK